MILSPSTLMLINGKSFIAFATASINTGVNVKFSPSLFLKSALILFLQFQMLVTSASTNEVTCGEVCFERTMCSEINFLILSISMISSPSIVGILGAGAAFCGEAAGEETEGV